MSLSRTPDRLPPHRQGSRVVVRGSPVQVPTAQQRLWLNLKAPKPSGLLEHVSCSADTDIDTLHTFHSHFTNKGWGAGESSTGGSPRKLPQLMCPTSCATQHFYAPKRNCKGEATSWLQWSQAKHTPRVILKRVF